MTSVVTLKDVNFAYRDTPVLSDVSFSVMPKQFVAIIGPNGGGKTTLLKLIMGLLQPNSGTIEVFGSSPQQCLTEIAYVPQALRFDRQFPISVLELVLSGRLSHLKWYGRFHEEDKTIALEALRTVGLQDLSDRAFGNLSGGQAQRALIARALASKPKILLLDEPTAHVDSQAEADIYALLQQLRQEMTIMMVTHDLRAAIEQVDQVLCVQGRVTPLKPQEVCEHFAVGLYHLPLIDLSGKDKQ